MALIPRRDPTPLQLRVCTADASSYFITRALFLGKLVLLLLIHALKLVLMRA